MAWKLLRWSILIDFPNRIKERNMVEKPKILEQVKQKIRLKHYFTPTFQKLEGFRAPASGISASLQQASRVKL